MKKYKITDKKFPFRVKKRFLLFFWKYETYECPEDYGFYQPPIIFHSREEAKKTYNII